MPTCKNTKQVRLNDQKPYACKICKKGFRRDTLKRHLMIHKGELPYSCQYCEKKFRQKSNLKLHERIHTGEKPYTCNQCEKGFSDPTSYKRHIKFKCKKIDLIKNEIETNVKKESETESLEDSGLEI